MQQFGFLKPEWPELHEAAARAEALARSDPRAALFHARRMLELMVHWLYRADARLQFPYTDSLGALLHEPSFEATLGEALYRKAVFVKDQGNTAVHKTRQVTEAMAAATLRELHHLAFWLARSYSRGKPPPDSLTFDPAKLPPPIHKLVKQSIDQLRKLGEELRAKDAKLAELLASHALLDEANRKLRAQVAEAIAANAARPDTHDYNEAATRDEFIDAYLREAGWNPDAPQVREYPVTGMPNETGLGFCDYVLWGGDGKPLAVVEAKATRHSAQKGQQQAKLYADCLEAMTGQRPIIFTTNGYQHYIWDDTRHPPRQVAGFYRRDELELLIQRRTTRRKLGEAVINGDIVGRHYQTRAIRRIGETFEDHHQRRALVVMATGAGKTRTVIALTDLLMRCNWAKRILFLADRVALVKQAANAFKQHLPESAPVNLVADKAAQGGVIGRVYVSTYPTMMSLIEERDGGGRRFGPGHFDLIIVDEAHRSIYKKYGAIFDWFDSLLVGLTATPKDEIDRNTYRLFNLDDGVPTDAYTLEEAVADKYLVRMKAVSVPLRFVRQGITYDDLSEEEKEEWDAAEWEENPPDTVEANAVNTWLFNKDTVDKVLEHLMTHGQKVEAGDRLGKTIIFAKNSKHAAFIAERFDANYPHLRGHFARQIDYSLPYAQTLIEDFEKPDKAPHIAISVDMLDTGIDVPEVVNLVFFKLVRSKTKFWQMIGRGTRLRPDLFGPGQDKQFFYVFDFCQNLEFFSQEMPAVEGAVGESLSARLFRARLEVVGGLDARMANAAPGDAELRAEVTELLRAEVAAMNIDNFIIRPKRRLVETYAKPEAWAALDMAARTQLAEEVAGLPTQLEPEKVEAKQFDLMMLNLQLCVLTGQAGFERYKKAVVDVAAALAEQSSIPAIAAQMELILDIQTDAWWQDVTLPMLEGARKKLRGLAYLIEKRKRAILYTDFEDQIGEGQEVVFGRFVSTDEFAKFREKAKHFLKAHENHLAVVKLRTNKALTPTDLAELERMLLEAGTAAEVAKAREESEGLGLFVRSLVGLDRGAAAEALAAFQSGRAFTANQLQFLNTIIDHLTQHGTVEAARLYEAPYTKFSAKGVDGVFKGAEVVELIRVLDEIRGRAVA